MTGKSKSTNFRTKLHMMVKDFKRYNLERLGKIPVMKETLRSMMLPQYLDHPMEVSIEVTSACNADCIMCPRKDMSRRMAPMDFELFKTVVDQCAELGVKKIFPNGYGEITTMGKERIRQYLGYIREKMPHVEIGINSNGMLMNEEISRIFIDLSVDWINVTFDGVTAETYENVRRYLKLDQVEHNVRSLRRLRDEMGKTKPLVIVHMIKMKETRHEQDLFLEKWTDECDTLYFSEYSNRGGTLESQREFLPNGGYPACFHLWNSFNIWADGTVALCCNDWDGKEPLGNLRENSIYEIWHSDTLKRFRELHLEGKAYKIPMCRDCDSFHGGPSWWRKDTILDRFRKLKLVQVGEKKILAESLD